MKTCSYCGRENTDEVTCCAECGTEEFKVAAIAAAPAEDAQKEWVTVETCPTLIDADVLAGQLEASGIKVFLPDQFVMQTFSLGAQGFGAVRVQVSPANLEQAKEILSSPTSVVPPPPPEPGMGV